MNKERRQMNRGGRALAVCIALLVIAFTAAPAQAEFDIENFDVSFESADGSTVTQAGSHPFAVTTTFDVKSIPVGLNGRLVDEAVEDLLITQAPGFLGKPKAAPHCSNADFLSTAPESNMAKFLYPNCPASTAVGVTGIALANKNVSFYQYGSVYNLVPPPGKAARFGFTIASVPVQIDIGVRGEPPYNIVAESLSTPQTIEVTGAGLTLWGTPADTAHDPLRTEKCLSTITSPFNSYNPGSFGIECPTSIKREPLITLPRACEGPLETRWEARSWYHPETWISGSILSHDEFGNPQGFTGCDKLAYEPEVEAKPSADSAESGTGLDFNLDFEDEGLENPDGVAASDTKKAVVTLPEGVTVNPSLGEGLGVCTPDQIARETVDSEPGAGCPNSSKIGTLEAEIPVIDEPLKGPIFLARQDDPATTEPGAENPFDSLIALYFVLRNADIGAIAKLPVKVEPDPRTGRLIVTLDDVPQFPVARFNAHLREGQRAPLITPAACGTYTTVAKLYPWADKDNPREAISDFQITRGKGGGPCPPGGVPPFEPKFEAGSENNNAGSFTPFNMRLQREDGEQNLTKFSATLPPGVLGSLAGVEKCGDFAVAVAKSKTGREEQASPSCPANSEIGNTIAGAGVGSALTYVPGKIYLSGPYKGAPLSVVAITPAVAGPFDAGTVAVRLGLTLNPKTAEVEVDGAASDPIPHILNGIVLKLRDLRVNVDRPNFILNPTSCDESSVKATAFGSFVDVFNPADDQPVDLSTRYQAANCLNLGFNPKLGLRLKGGTKRGSFPGLKANYKPTEGHANVKDLVVRLPRSAFLEQGHIRTICTRVQFAADNCPKAAQYGYIRAWTPLLDEPLQGPVWLRSSNHKLPDLVFDLKGLVDVEVQTRIDSVNGGIRARVEDAPDAPISRVILNMQGGRKGLIVNSRNLCTKRKARASVKGTGQNGKQFTRRPVLRSQCGRKAKRSSHSRVARVAGASAVG